MERARFIDFVIELVENEQALGKIAVVLKKYAEKSKENIRLHYKNIQRVVRFWFIDRQLKGEKTHSSSLTWKVRQ